MTTSHPSSRDISRKLVVLIFGVNSFSALIIFLYFSVIDPLPVGGVAVRSLETEDIVTFGIVGVVIFVGAFAIISRLERPIGNWLRLIEAGTPASELSPSVARLVLIWPLIGASLVAATGLLVAIFFSILYDNPGNFVGIAIGGSVTTTIVYFGTDLIWRQQVPTFFPEGNLSVVPAFRLWVRRRLLLDFTLIGGLTPILLVILSQEDRGLRREILRQAARFSLKYDVLLIPRVIGAERWKEMRGFSLYQNVQRDAADLNIVDGELALEPV